MIPLSLHPFIANNTPKINPHVANGLAVQHLDTVQDYIDSIFRSTASDFPMGLKYTGCRRCTPEEEYLEMTRNKSSKESFEVSKSDVFLMEYKFEFNGVPIKSKYLFLPYVGQAGIIYLGGSRFIISPVLADKVISIGNRNIFIRLLKAKLTFNRTPHHFLANSNRETIQVAWSEIYNTKAGGPLFKPSVKAFPCLVHYLLCKHGVTGMFQKYANVKPVAIGEQEITLSQYPETEYVIISTAGIKPKGVGKAIYIPSELKLVFRKQDYTNDVKNLLVGLFYIVDHFPFRVKAQYVESTRLWMTLLGLLIWTDSVSEGKLHSDINDHICSLDEYIDALVAAELNEIGYPCENIYHMFFTIIQRFDEWLLYSDDKVSTMYDKKISINYYVCYDIIESISRLYFKLKNAQKKELDAKKIENIMGMFLTSGKIYGMVRDHGEVSTVTASGDNKFFKTTGILIPQSTTSKAKKKKDRAAINDPAKRLHVSIAEIGGAMNLVKSEPTGRSRISPFIQLSPTGLVLRNTKNKDMLDAIQERIKR
jgi:hypothetical protein